MKKTTATDNEYYEPSEKLSQQRETIEMASMKTPEYYDVISDYKSMSEPDYLVPFKQFPQQDEPVRLVEDYEVITDCKLRYSCKLINECRVCEKQNVYEVFFSFYF
jgi:hypothetical protein